MATFHIILGGLLAIIGGIIGSFLNAKWARRKRMDEIIAQKKIDANQAAYQHIKQIEALLIQGTLEQVRDEINKYEAWLFNNRLFLPGRFPDKWLELRNGIGVILHRRKAGKSQPEELTKMEMELKQINQEAMDEIYKDMNMEKLKAKPFIERMRKKGIVKGRFNG